MSGAARASRTCGSFVLRASEFPPTLDSRLCLKQVGNQSEKNSLPQLDGKIGRLLGDSLASAFLLLGLTFTLPSFITFPVFLQLVYILNSVE